MTRKFVDCRGIPSESNCTLMISGEEDEVMRTAVQHAVSVHSHTDDPELRRGIREGMRDDTDYLPGPGSFVQLIDFRTDHIDDIQAMTREWANEIGSERKAQWTIASADHDQPGCYVAIVAFPDRESALANSAHPATEKFALRLQDLTEGEPVYRNLDVATMVRY
jgi:predicted small metal-binding protein